jgi:hypothetical protein
MKNMIDLKTWTKQDGKVYRDQILVIAHDTWAESGGTGGMFGKLFKQGRLKIEG